MDPPVARRVFVAATLRWHDDSTMLIDERNGLWDARPFTPFEIAMSNGETDTVTSPKRFLMSPSRSGLVTSDGRMHTLALGQVNRVTAPDPAQDGAAPPMERK